MDPHNEQCCKVVRGGQAFTGKQGLTYFTGICHENTGSKALCLHMLEVPPGGRASAHFHRRHESAVYLLSGQVEHLWGDRLENHDVIRPGDCVYIPPGVPHAVFNLSDVEPAVAIVARTDPSEQESVVLTPDLEVVVQAFLAAR
jgi:uncharacterized RmlC-like cupin family protein